jgi:collagen type V/XI/XXIV/XXVII alpha
MRKPVGTRENPVRTCKDLHYGHPQFADGWYWIDANLGMADDAVYVYCNMTAGGETCVFPDIHSSQMPNIPWRKENDRTDWYSNLRGGFRISYETIGVVQMTFLKLLSENAYQNFTYSCMNSVAWYSAKEDSYDSSIRLLGENEIEIGYEDAKLRPNILVDGCKVGICQNGKLNKINIISLLCPFSVWKEQK